MPCELHDHLLMKFSFSQNGKLPVNELLMGTARKVPLDDFHSNADVFSWKSSHLVTTKQGVLGTRNPAILVTGPEIGCLGFLEVRVVDILLRAT